MIISVLVEKIKKKFFSKPFIEKKYIMLNLVLKFQHLI